MTADDQTVWVHTTPKYPIYVSSGLLGRVGGLLREHLPNRSRAMIITDSNVGPLYASQVLESLRQSGFQAEVSQVPAGEESKTLQYASYLYDRLLEVGADRHSVVLTVGGGVIGDMGGFVAATFMRGIPFVQIPTTLLCMVDASVGGKVAVDHPRSKNVIGAFHQPAFVVADMKVLQTLPRRDFLGGLAEVAKHAVALEGKLGDWLENHADKILSLNANTLAELVAWNCRIKAKVVEEDERETTGRRALLNYGHTFGHAFETATQYTRFRHGEAVALGMMCAAELGVRLNRVPADFAQRQKSLLEQLKLPTQVPRDLLDFDLLSIMRRDKKNRAGKLRLILPTRWGQADLVDDVPDEPILAAIHASAHAPFADPSAGLEQFR